MRNLSKDFKGQRPILIQPSQAESYLERSASIEMPLGAKISDMGEMLEAIFGAKPVLEKFPPYAIVPVKGVISKSISELEKLCGCCDINDVEEMLEECERDSSIKVIIFDIDSPGGTSVGVPELANRVKDCSKETIAFTSSECCSAAYWIGSQANSFYATPSSSVGSVGVYIAYPDCSEAYKMEGVRMEVIKAGIFKGAGIQGTSLDAGQRKMLQDEVNDIHSDFKAAVKSVREFVEDPSMEGQIFSGKRGAEAGLVTSLVNGFDELMESLNAQVAAQMEADEGNDERSENSESVTTENDEDDEDDEDDYEVTKMASVRALAGISPDALKPVAGKKKSDEDDPDYDPDEDPELKDKTPGDEKKDGTEPAPEAEEAEGEEDEETESKVDEKAVEESESGDKAIETDDEHSRKGTKRHNGKTKVA